MNLGKRLAVINITELLTSSSASMNVVMRQPFTWGIPNPEPSIHCEGLCMRKVLLS